MARVTFLICCFKAKMKEATSSKVHLPSYIGRSDEMTEKPQHPDWPGIGAKKQWYLDEGGVGSVVLGAGVARTSLVVSS